MIITKVKCEIHAFVLDLVKSDFGLLVTVFVTFLARCENRKYTWGKEHQKEARNQALQWQVSFPEEGKTQRLT